MWKAISPIVVLTSLLLGSGSPEPEREPVQIGTWNVEDLTPGGTWKHSDMASFVAFGDLQTAHAQSVFFGNERILDKRIKARIEVKTTIDDDYVGFVLGFEPGDGSRAQANYLLVDWKKQTQFVTGQGTSTEGLALSLVTGPGQVAPNGGSIDFWNHTGDVTELARGATLGNTGWSEFVTYDVEIAYGATNLTIHVNGIKEFDIQRTFGDGYFGWYDFSQTMGVFDEPVIEGM